MKNLQILNCVIKSIYFLFPGFYLSDFFFLCQILPHQLTSSQTQLKYANQNKRTHVPQQVFNEQTVMLDTQNVLANKKCVTSTTLKML